MNTSPIQVVLNADNFRVDRKTQRPVSNGKDFFLGQDEAFAIHRQRIMKQVNGVASQIEEHSAAFGSVGYARVVMRAQALAKSHRPTSALFKPDIAPVVGAEGLGEIICRVTPDGLEQVSERIGRAEAEGKTRIDNRTGEEVPAPSRYRCEVGAIEQIELWGRSSRRRFEIERAIEWLGLSGTGHGYVVDLFELPPPRSDWDTLPSARRKLFASFVDGLRDLGLGLHARRLDGSSDVSQEVQVRMVRSSPNEKAETYIADVEAHRRLLGFLETHPLVREVRLPARIVRSSPTSTSQPGGSARQPIAPPDPSRSYPKVGVIDGGISAQLRPWVKHQSGLLDPAHASLDHGTFIAGLLVEGASRNPALGLDPDGCELSDLNLFPDVTTPGVFDIYFPNGSSDFFDEVEAAVAHCREQFGTRVFNLSVNAVAPAQLDRYSTEARRLDEIAERHDVLIVVSAGNLSPADMRTEWPNDDAKAAAILAAKRDDGLFIPAESVRNVSVAALNPTGLSSCIGEAPARYSRRGPGLRTGIKPDLCHFGGSATHCPSAGSGLHSISPAGASTNGCGTSYAAPLVAKTLATLDHAIEGDVSRETLIALTVHGAETPKILKKKVFKGVAPQLAGFGRPKDAASLLAGSPHEITLLFSSRIGTGKMLEFRFAWPPSLVDADGKCSGEVKLTLVATPPLDYRFGPEFVRVNIDAALQQEDAKGKFSDALEPTHVFFEGGGSDERTMIQHQLKWAPTKTFAKSMRGRGVSSNWRLSVNYLTRAGVELPPEGVPFSVLVTISDPKGEKPVFQEMRQALESTGIRTADIRTAARVSARV